MLSSVQGDVFFCSSIPYLSRDAFSSADISIREMTAASAARLCLESHAVAGDSATAMDSALAFRDSRGQLAKSSAQAVP